MTGRLQRAAQRGISLIEIMVTMAIGLVIVLIVATIYINGVSTLNFRAGQSENLGNSRYTLGILDSEFTKAGYRRDPTQAMELAFPADGSANLNGCTFGLGQAFYVTTGGDLCIRFQARDNNEKDCAGTAAGISSLVVYEPPPAPAVGAGMFVERFSVELVDGKWALFCQAGNPNAKVPVADNVRGVLFEYGVGSAASSFAERRVESYKTTVPAATEAIRSLRYSVLVASTASNLTGGMDTTVCTRWTNLGGTSTNCDTSNGQLYQIASGSLNLRNLMP